MNINNNNFYINDKLIIKNKEQMELKYKGELDRIELKANGQYLWELYGGFKQCDYIISNNTNCNILYTVNTLNATYISPTDNSPNGIINFYDNYLQYSENDDNNKANIFNILKYTNIDDSIYSLSITEKGNIELNNGQYTLHKEYYKPDEYYYLYVRNKNLILRSNTGEYKWAANKIITNRAYDAGIIEIGDSFEEGEMIYCGDYSMIILDGKLFYRDHVSLTSTQVNLGKKTSNYLSTIVINDDNIAFFDKDNKLMFSKVSPYESNENSKLRCEKSNRTIVWDNGEGKILWRYPENTTATTITTTATTATTAITTSTDIKSTKTTTTSTTTTTIEPSTTYITTYTTNYSTEYITETTTTVTTTPKYSYSTYTNVSYQGKIGSAYYLGVNELKEFVKIEAKYGGTKNKPMKYTKWLISSENKPSYMYLANANGSLSNYCLNVGQNIKEDKSYYLSISKCSQTSYLFKYNVSFTDYEKKKISGTTNIAVYKNSSTLLTNSKGIPYCIYYTDTLRIEECKDPKGYENFDWLKYKNGYYTKTSTKYETSTSTKYMVTSTVKPVVTSSVITSVIYPTVKPTATNTLKPTQSNNAPSIALKFKGVYGGDSSLFLSIPELEVNESFDISSSNEYYTWYVTSKTEPSYLYLSDGVSGASGNPTDYCLDLGKYVNGNNYNYLRIVNCSEAKYKFKYNSLSNNDYGTINVYDNNGNPYAINDVVVCIYYSGTPRVDNCGNSSNKMGWKMV